MQQEMTLHTSDVELLKEFLDLVETNIHFSTISNYQYFVESFSVDVRLGRAQWHLWGWRISFTKSEVDNIVSALTYGSIAASGIGRIPVVGWIAAIAVGIHLQIILDGFNKNNGRNGVRIDIN